MKEYNYTMSDDADKVSADGSLIKAREKRVYYLYNEIDKEAVAKMGFEIILHNLKDDEAEEKEKGFKRKPIQLYINSYGGSVYDMWSLIDTISNSKTPVYTYCDGYAMSAAFNIFLAGHKRFCSKYTTFMYHQMRCYRAGKYQDLVDDREQLDYLNSCSEQYVIERTKITKEEMKAIRERKKDYYFNAKKALEIGIVDKIRK